MRGVYQVERSRRPPLPTDSKRPDRTGPSSDPRAPRTHTANDAPEDDGFGPPDPSLIEPLLEEIAYIVSFCERFDFRLRALGEVCVCVCVCE